MKYIIPKFIVKTSKLGNFYFYLKNLAFKGETIGVREEYNKIFLETTGKLNSSEKRILNKFKNLILNIEKSKNLSLTYLFFNSNNLDDLKRKLNKKEFDIVKEVFEKFQQRLSYFWDKELSKTAETILKNFEENLKNNFNFISKVIKNLFILYGPSKVKKEVKVFLVFLPSKIEGRSGKHLDKYSSIILEISPKIAKTRKALEILLHEYTHLSFESPSFLKKIYKLEKEEENLQKKINKIFKGKISLSFLIKEIIATSATMSFPKNYFPNDPFAKLIVKISRKIKPLIRYYLKNKLKIDKKFLKEIVLLLEKVFNNAKSLQIPNKNIR